MIILAPLLTAKNKLVPILFSRISDNLDASSSNSTLDDTSIVLQHEYSSSKIKAVLEVQSLCKVESPISGFNGSTGSSANNGIFKLVN